MKWYNKISIKLLLLTIGGFFISYVLFVILYGTFVYMFVQDINNYTGTEVYWIFNTYVLGIIGIPIVLFLAIFLIGINRRVNYLKNITKTVGEIKDVSYLKEIDIKGKDEISELVKGINIMSERLQESFEKEKESEKVKNELIVAVSHDLKTPLTSIVGYLEFLSKKGDLSKENMEYITLVYNKSLCLKGLIDELFEYTKLANSDIKLQKQSFDIGVLTSQILGDYEHFFKGKNIKVEFNLKGDDSIIVVDAFRMARVIENIVSNAEKYSYENSVFKVEIEKTQKGIKMTFENEGDTISRENLQRIFERMYRVDKSRNQKIEGSGLGLAISKKIVELHRGTIEASSFDNRVIFKVELPFGSDEF